MLKQCPTGTTSSILNASFAPLLLSFSLILSNIHHQSFHEINFIVIEKTYSPRKKRKNFHRIDDLCICQKAIFKNNSNCIGPYRASNRLGMQKSQRGRSMAGKGQKWSEEYWLETVFTVSRRKS